MNNWWEIFEAGDQYLVKISRSQLRKTFRTDNIAFRILLQVVKSILMAFTVKNCSTNIVCIFIVLAVAQRTYSMVIKAGCSDSSSSSDNISSECSDIEDDIDEQSYETMPLCQSSKRIIEPNELLRAAGDDFEFDKNFSQTIEVEVCENAGSPCNDYPLMTTKCRQRYLSIQLLVISKNSTKSQLRTFRIPSNCECVFYRNWWMVTQFYASVSFFLSLLYSYIALRVAISIIHINTLHSTINT